MLPRHSLAPPFLPSHLFCWKQPEEEVSAERSIVSPGTAAPGPEVLVQMSDNLLEKLLYIILREWGTSPQHS